MTRGVVNDAPFQSLPPAPRRLTAGGRVVVLSHWAAVFAVLVACAKTGLASPAVPTAAMVVGITGRPDGNRSVRHFRRSSKQLEEFYSIVCFSIFQIDFMWI